MTRSPHVTLKSIANNAEIDVICERWQAVLEPPRATLNARLGRTSLRATGSGSEAGTAQAPDEATQEPSHALGRFAPLAMTIPPEDWVIPREAGADWRAEAKDAHAKWWEGRIARQREIDAFIAKAADIELLSNRPYEDKARMRVAGPFTVESLSPHRVGDALPRRVAPIRTAWHGSHRGEGDQPLRRRGDEGVSGMRLGVQV